MAKTTVEIVVKREQFDKLQADVNQLNNTKINIQTKEFQRDMSEAAKATGQAADNLKKFVQVQDGTAQATKEIHEYNDGIRTTVQYTDKLNKETGDLELAQKKITTTFKDATKAENEADKAGKEHNETVKKQGLLYDILGRSVSSFLARMVAYRAVYAGIRAVTNGFKEALETLKAVDDELVTVRKVTGFDQWQMAGVEEQAYAVASKYGTSAADYTSGVAAFARAGYKDLSGDLAELAEKTKIVGDTTADVAQQFLLSVDAAYQYKGNIEKLTAVLDGANEIDNRFATSIEKIAEGMGIVAPVAAQMHVSVDELAAGIGTITAVTQRTGTEAARALRAIFLNIVGDTKTEIEEGVTWTTGEIAGLRDVIKLYAKDAWDAAQASGGIIDPMKAIEGLSKSVKDGVLTEAKLMEMVSDIGGKLRTSQLLAIVNNWDMYESMLETYRNAYGSADKEIENAMDSWTRKTEVLKNKWTEFVKTGLNSSAFKGFLDILVAIVERIGTLAGVITRLIPLAAALKLREMANTLKTTAEGATGLAGAFQKIGISAKGLNIAAAAVGALGLAWSAVSYLIEDAKRKHEEEVQAQYEAAGAAVESSNKITELAANMSMAKAGTDQFRSSARELADTLKVDVPEGVDAAIEKLREYTEAQLRANAGAANTAKLTAESELLKAHGPWDRWNVGRDVEYLKNLGSVYKGLGGDVERATSGLIMNGGFADTSTIEGIRAYRKAAEDVVSAFDDYVMRGGDVAALNEYIYTEAKQYLNDTASVFADFEKAEKDAFDTKVALAFADEVRKATVQNQSDLDALIDAFSSSEKYTNEEKDALIELANKYYDFSENVETSTETVKEETDALNKNQKALEANATATEKAAAAKKDAEAAVAEFCDALFDETGELTTAGKAALAASNYLADLTQAEMNARLEAAQANYANLRAQLAGVAADALKAAYALIALETAYLNGETSGIDFNAARRLQGQAGNAYSLLSQIQALEREINTLTVSTTAVNPYTSGYSSGSSHSGSSHSGGSSGGSHSSSASTEDKKLSSLKGRVSLLKSELSLMKERGDSDEDQIAKMREIQAALEAERAYLASIGGDQITINNLTQEWYSYHNEIEKMMASEAEDAEKQANALQNALDAQRALNNALNNRSVRYYNGATGQWEWTANQSDVQNAQNNLRDAIQNLPADQRSLFLYSLYHSPGGGPFGSTIHDFLPGEIASLLAGGGVSVGKGVNNYGNTYNFGGMNFNWQSVRSMTLEQFAQLAGGLGIYNNSP